MCKQAACTECWRCWLVGGLFMYGSLCRFTVLFTHMPMKQGVVTASVQACAHLLQTPRAPIQTQAGPASFADCFSVSVGKVETPNVSSRVAALCKDSIPILAPSQFQQLFEISCSATTLKYLLTHQHSTFSLTLSLICRPRAVGDWCWCR
jgi:hypothetical protein